MKLINLKENSYNKARIPITSKRLILILTFALFTFKTAFANADDERVSQGLSYRAAIIVVAMIIAWISRRFLLRKMNLMMMKKSKEVEIDSSNLTKSKEVATTNELKLIEVNADSEMKETKATREKLIKRAKKNLKKLFFNDLIAIIVYGILGLLFYINEGAEVFDSPNLLIQVKRFTLTYFLYLLLLLVWNIGRYMGYRHQFRAYSKGVFGFFKPVWKLIFWPFQSRWCLTLSVAIMFIVLFGFLKFRSLLLIAALLIHLFLIYRLKVDGRKTSNLKLLILRVFLIKKTSSFTFAGLVNFWQHFGSYFTVADPSFYKVNWKKKYNYYFPIYIIIIFLLFTQLTDNAKFKDLPSIFGAFVFLLIIGSIFYIIFSVKSLKRKFISSEELLKKRLQYLDKWPKGYDNTFKEFPVMCYDNTWKQAVNELVNKANVILMDLRGYSEINKGCEYEVNFLFDNVPAERIVFLAYKDSIPLIKNLIKEQWEMLLETSPNLKTKKPESLLYIITKQNNKDIQGIIDVLLETVDKNDVLKNN